jgi:DNA-directed RNA polymerase specialized sigma24 family protein
MTASEPDDQHIASLVKRTCEGDEQAWQELWSWLDPRLTAMVRKFRLARISHEEDDRRGVVLDVMSRLREDDFRRLRLFADAAERDARLALLPWLKVVAKRVAIDYMRAHPDYVNPVRHGNGPRGAGQWKDPKSLPPPSLLPGERPPMTRDGTAREMLAHARDVLPEQHYQALALKVGGESAADIARALGLASAAEAERIVRSALERLRRKFRTTMSGNEP